MTFLSPVEDFVKQTLASVRGTLEQLRFAGELRESDGRYHHWGLARIYGDRNAHEAISEVHTNLYLQILATRIQDLYAEAGETARDSSLQDYVRGLKDLKGQLLPNDLGGGLPDHFSLTLETLSRLAKHSRRPTHPGASPPQ